MPKIFYSIQTPLGTFASSGQAAAAHKADRGLILRRCETDPEHYKKIPKPPRVYENSTPVLKKGHMPSWSQYKFLPEEQKESIYLAWCRKKGHAPDSESGALAFFDAMDSVSSDLAESLELLTDLDHEPDPESDIVPDTDLS
jgi:hypothetical protein